MHEDVIGAIYDAPLAERPWADLAGCLRSRLDASGAMFKFRRQGAREDQTRFIFDANWEVQESWPLYDSVYRYLDPTCHDRMEVGALYDFETIRPFSPDPEREQYLRFCHSFDLNHALFTYLGEYQGTEAWFSISRGDGRGAFGPADATFLIALLPHLRRAVAIHARLEMERAASRLHADALSDLGFGIILVNAAGGIISTNALAEQLLGSGTAIARVQDRLKIKGVDGQSLSRSITAAAGSVIVANARGEDPLHMLVRPWSTDAHEEGQNFIIYIDRPDAQLPLKVTALQRRFGLTLAEARMATLLAAGRTIEAAGDDMGITVASARTYCKRVLARTGAARQADLIRLVLASVARFDQLG